MIKILIIAGARPNFMKIAPIITEIKKHDTLKYTLIHTGQHFDKNMSDTFFEDLGLPYPDINLDIHGGSVSEQTGKVIVALDEQIKLLDPTYILVVGDVNATIAGAIAAKQNKKKVIHIESGLRSGDMDMPEEVNRIVTDRLSDLLFVTETAGVENLKNEGITQGVHLVGNVMIDSLVANLSKIDASPIRDTYGLRGQPYALVTIHRPSNTDVKEKLESMLSYLRKISEKITIVFPIHPRTRKNIEIFGLTHLLETDNIISTPPLGYLDFIHLLKYSTFVMTDSGGIQEESTFLQVPCLTLRDNTERPITCEVGTNTLVGSDPEKATPYIEDILAGTYKKGSIPDLWDGKSAERIIKVLSIT